MTLFIQSSEQPKLSYIVRSHGRWCSGSFAHSQGLERKGHEKAFEA